jgi:hypothetical protein
MQAGRWNTSNLRGSLDGTDNGWRTRGLDERARQFNEKKSEHIMSTYKRIVLASRPKGQVVPENFRLEEAPVPAIKDGEILIRNHYLSLDPYMRGRMEETKSYAAPPPIGETMIGGTVGEISESKNPK